MSSEKCVYCGEEVWLGAFFEGKFLCNECYSNAALIINQLCLDLKNANETIEGLRKDAKGSLAFLDDALNSGDGVYRP